MKKLYYFLFIFCAAIFTSSVMSQSLQLSDESGNVANGTIFYVWGDTITGTLMTKAVYVQNTSSGTIEVKTKKIENSLIPGTSCNICFAGQCYLSTVFTSLNSAVLSSNTTDTTATIDYKPKGHLGESIVTLVFFDVSNPDDSSWVFVHFNGTPAGIADNNMPKNFISNAYPNPAVNYTSFDYSFAQGTTSAKFVLSDILGSKVKEEVLNNLSGTLLLNTSEIEGGLYFYSFYENDRLILTKKIIIKQ